MNENTKEDAMRWMAEQEQKQYEHATVREIILNLLEMDPNFRSEVRQLLANESPD